MARSPQIQKDKTRRKVFAKIEKTYRQLKFQSLNIHLSDKERNTAKEKLALMDPKGFRSRIKNRCIVTGKSRGIIQKFRISQTTVRLLARSGGISGMKKASWLFFLLLW